MTTTGNHYNDGWNARIMGKTEADCPHSETTHPFSRALWLEGHREAQGSIISDELAKLLDVSL